MLVINISVGKDGVYVIALCGFKPAAVIIFARSQIDNSANESSKVRVEDGPKCLRRLRLG